MTYEHTYARGLCARLKLSANADESSKKRKKDIKMSQRVPWNQPDVETVEPAHERVQIIPSLRKFGSSKST